MRSIDAGSFSRHEWILRFRDSIGCLFRVQASLWASWSVDWPHSCAGLLFGTRDVVLRAYRLGDGSTEGAGQAERRGQDTQSSF